MFFLFLLHFESNFVCFRLTVWLDVSLLSFIYLIICFLALNHPMEEQIMA